MRKRARDATFPASRFSSETSLDDSIFTAGKPIYVHESDGALHSRVPVFFPLPGRELLGTRRHEFLKCLRIDWLGQVMFEARFKQRWRQPYPTARRLADIQLPF